MAQSAEPTQVVYLGWLPTGPEACRLAPGARSGQPEPFCTAEWLNEEPDMGKPFVRFCEGMRHNWCMAEIMWHRRETRRQTENTNVMPGALEGLVRERCRTDGRLSGRETVQSEQLLPTRAKHAPAPRLTSSAGEGVMAIHMTVPAIQRRGKKARRAMPRGRLG